VGFRFRKLADESGGPAAFAAERGPQVLGEQSSPVDHWPLAGVEIVGDPPQEANLPMDYVRRAVAEGWMVGDGENVVHRPGGPPQDKWRVTHTFVHYDTITVKTTTGDLRYRVAHQPDKYAGSGGDRAKVTDERYAAGETRVDWFYTVRLEA
jgi:hypothetical protein